MSSRDTVTEPFDVFRNKLASPVWIGTAPSMEKALDGARKDLEEHGPCDYIILDIRTNEKTVVSHEQLAR